MIDNKSPFLHMEGVVVAVDTEGAMLEVFDRKKRRSYHFFTPFAMMPESLGKSLGVGCVVHVRSWVNPDCKGRMLVAMDALDADTVRLSNTPSW